MDFYRHLIEAVFSPPVLALPVLGMRFFSDYHRNSYQTGGEIIKKPPEGERRPIGCLSLQKKPAEKSYGASEL